MRTSSSVSTRTMGIRDRTRIDRSFNAEVAIRTLQIAAKLQKALNTSGADQNPEQAPTLLRQRRGAGIAQAHCACSTRAHLDPGQTTQLLLHIGISGSVACASVRGHSMLRRDKRAGAILRKCHRARSFSRRSRKPRHIRICDARPVRLPSTSRTSSSLKL